VSLKRTDFADAASGCKHVSVAALWSGCTAQWYVLIFIFHVVASAAGPETYLSS
jgi:hypothetical protein